jgi:hypothetical protein
MEIYSISTQEMRVGKNVNHVLCAAVSLDIPLEYNTIPVPSQNKKEPNNSPADLPNNPNQVSSPSRCGTLHVRSLADSAPVFTQSRQRPLEDLMVAERASPRGSLTGWTVDLQTQRELAHGMEPRSGSMMALAFFRASWALVLRRAAGGQREWFESVVK